MFFNRVPIESLKICNSNAMNLGKNSSPPSLAQSPIAALKDRYQGAKCDVIYNKTS